MLECRERIFSTLCFLIRVLLVLCLFFLVVSLFFFFYWQLFFHCSIEVSDIWVSSPRLQMLCPKFNLIILVRLFPFKLIKVIFFMGTEILAFQNCICVGNHLYLDEFSCLVTFELFVFWENKRKTRNYTFTKRF